MKKIIQINGMSCGHCEGRVKKELEAVEGVESADVSAADKKAVVSLLKDVDDEKLKAAVEEAGYEYVMIIE